VGLTHKAHAHPHELSGGEQQRVAIARAIVNNPTVLLLDEPTGNLDPQTGADIAEVLRKVNELGTTIMMATHDRHLVDEMRRRVVRIAGGRIVSDEEHGVYHPEDQDLSELRRAPVEADDEVHPFESTVEFDRTYAPPPPAAPEPKPAPPIPVAEPVIAMQNATPLSEKKSADFSRPADKPMPRSAPPLSDYVTNTLENRAPLGSPDNPIVQLDRR
jgi:energy-coupling factor transporter ATP-binding protein EcfA2